MNKLLSSYSSIPIPAKASLWFILASILQKGITFITVPLFTRLLSPEEFGLINVYQSWLGIIIIFATLTLWGGVFNNGMVKYDEDRDVFLSSLQGLSTTVTISLFLVFLFFSDIISKLIELPVELIMLMFIQIMFTPSLNLWSAKQRFDFKYKKLIVITLVMSIANPVVGLILVLISEDGGVARIVSIALVQTSIGVVLYYNNLKSGKRFYHNNYWGYATAFNIPLIPHYLSQSILNHADRIMINSMVGTDKAGIYSVAYSVGMIFIFIVSSINSTFIPWTYKRLKEKSYESIEKASFFLLILLSAMILLLISFAPEIIKLMAPPEYREAIWTIPPISLSIYFIFLYGLFANIEFYFEENKFIMIASVIAAFLNVILNLLLIPLFGYIVAGYTTLISYVIYSFAHYIFMCKVLSKNNIKEAIYKANRIVILGLVLIASAFLITLTYNSNLIRYLFVVILGGTIIVKRKEIMKRIEQLRE